MLKKLGLFLVLQIGIGCAFADTSTNVEHGANVFDWQSCMASKMGDCMKNCLTATDPNCKENCTQASESKCKTEGYQKPQ